MELIQISHVQKAKGGEPSITFTLSGNIRLNIAAVKVLNEAAFDSEEKYYLHFYKEKANLCVRMDTDPTEGVYLRFDGSIVRRDATNIVASAKNIIQYFTKLLDWPLAEDRKKFIRYKVKTLVKDGIYMLE